MDDFNIDNLFHNEFDGIIGVSVINEEKNDWKYLGYKSKEEFYKHQNAYHFVLKI